MSNLSYNSQNLSSIKSNIQINNWFIFQIICLTILFILTLLGNLFFILTTLSCCKSIDLRNKKCFRLRNISRSSFYILNLSIADLSVALLSILPQIFWQYYQTFWSNSKVLCKLIPFCQVIEI